MEQTVQEPLTKPQQFDSISLFLSLSFALEQRTDYSYCPDKCLAPLGRRTMIGVRK